MTDINIFKAYDVRGIYPSEINEQAAADIAKAFAFYLRANKLVIGRDARASSPLLYKAIVNALVEVGVSVIDVGECTRPLHSYAIAKKNFPGGIMITASHSPAEYNGFKLIQHPCFQLSSPGGMDEVKKLVMNPDVIREAQQEKGSVVELNILDEYVNEVAGEFVDLKALTVVVDYGNGMGSLTARLVFEKLGIKVIPLYEEIDCTFPNHPSNPAEEKNLEELRKTVQMQKADLGIAFDGDADRAFIIDDTGRIIYPDILAAFLIPSELKGRSEKRVYYDLRFSRIVSDVLKKSKGKGIMMRVGNPFYKEKLVNEGGVFGVELSGHFMFQDHYNIDDGLFASLKVMEAVAEAKKKLSELVKPLLRYYSSPEINMKVNNPDDVLENVKKAFKDGKSVELDGVYISYPDWWFSLRKSNTEPLVRLRLETNSKEKLDEMKDKLLRIINQ